MVPVIMVKFYIAFRSSSFAKNELRVIVRDGMTMWDSRDTPAMLDFILKHAS